VRKLEDDYFEDWAAGTELDPKGFKQIMRAELRRREKGMRVWVCGLTRGEGMGEGERRDFT
jgi:hypothetical protein